jgi:uncharacterized protein YjbJ (UPF0337 family)
VNFIPFPFMNASTSSAPGSSTPGGELEQISPGAWPTASGGQTENSAPASATIPTDTATIPAAAEQLRDNWERNKGDFRKKYGELTDEDLRYVQGQEQALIDHVRQKTGCSRVEIEEALNLKPEQRR